MLRSVTDDKAESARAYRGTVLTTLLIVQDCAREWASALQDLNLAVAFGAPVLGYAFSQLHELDALRTTSFEGVSVEDMKSMQ